LKYVHKVIAFIPDFVVFLHSPLFLYGPLS